LRRCFPLSLVCFRSLVPSRFHFPASLGSRRFPALPSYYGRSDFRRSALRPAFEHELRTCPGRKFTAYRNNASGHSVSNHVMLASGIFCCHRFLSSRDAGFGLGRLTTASFQSLGRWLRASRLPGTLARRTPPNRVHYGVLAEPPRYGLAFRFQLLSTVGLSPPQFLSTTAWLTFA
jgi:hypothetical protein